MELRLKKIWIGLAEMKGLAKNGKSSGKGGFVTALGRATSRESFRKKVKRSLAEEGWHLVRLEEVEEFEARAARMKLDPHLLEIAASTRDESIGYATFHVYKLDAP